MHSFFHTPLLYLSQSPGWPSPLLTQMESGPYLASAAARLPDGVDAAATARRLLDDHGLLVSSRAGLLRVSPHVENDGEDVDRLLGALRTML